LRPFNGMLEMRRQSTTSDSVALRLGAQGDVAYRRLREYIPPAASVAVFRDSLRFDVNNRDRRPGTTAPPASETVT